MPDLNDIALFVLVVRGGSFAEAGRQRGLPANTVSRRVQALEAALGTRLLHRSTRQLTLTTAGQAFLDRCAGAVDCLDDAAGALRQDAAEPSGLIRVAAPTNFFGLFPMAWIAEFLDAHPRVRLDLVLSDARTDLIADRIDVAFRSGPLADSSHVARQLIGPRDSGLVASPAYLDARGVPRELEDLTRHDCLVPAHAGERFTWRLAGPDGVEREVPVTGRLMANTAQALREAALAGLGIALLSTVLTRADLVAGRLVPVLPRFRREGHTLSVLYASREQLPRAVTAFIDLVVGKLADPLALPEALRP
ncbi:LysR family transcriptional regulator [Mitsuaria sp. GD03876]|uniref:LysR family transcriptional regulator n=1 Tax=Mitsuaria sp. GD03876 TaxID=2975399 RepID=UPI002446FB6B|nr:LysR family transcriptional regulator [Mitsuaria sp. GD03876]MDH0867520.1 LysR family transcriptional regulator [Mitsuaria sp. GD03876]